MSKILPKVQNKKVCVFGIQGSGKTQFVKRLILDEFKKPIVYRMSEDFDKMLNKIHLYVPQPNKEMDEFEFFSKYVLNLAQQKKIDCVVIDEADLFFQSNWHINEHFRNLVLKHRHYGVSIILISRRPQDIPTVVVESSYYLVVYKLQGVNAIKKFKEIHKDLSDSIESLDYEKFNFVVQEIGKDPVVNDKILMVDKHGKPQ